MCKPVGECGAGSGVGRVKVGTKVPHVEGDRNSLLQNLPDMGLEPGSSVFVSGESLTFVGGKLCPHVQ